MDTHFVNYTMIHYRKQQRNGAGWQFLSMHFACEVSDFRIGPAVGEVEDVLMFSSIQLGASSSECLAKHAHGLYAAAHECQWKKHLTAL